MNKNKRLEKEKATQAYAALGIGLICVFFGIPLWWKTTEVYRVPLPYDEIEALTDTKHYWMPAAKTSLSLVHIFSVARVSNINSAGAILSEYIVSLQQATEVQKTVLESAQTIRDADSKLGEVLFTQSSGYHVILLPDDHPLKENTPYLGQFNVIFVCSIPKDVVGSSAKIARLFHNVLSRHHPLERLYEASAGLKQLKPDKESMRSLRFHTHYDITFTLFSRQPDIIDARWDMEEGVRLYLQPLLDKLKDYVDIKVKSQTLFYPGFYIRPHKDYDTGEHFLDLQNLPHMINPLETKLGFQASNNPNLNFIVYVPTRDQSPMYIRNNKGERERSNSFLSPRWGGIHIYNTPSPGPNDTLPMRVNIDLHQVMQIFLTQIRMLLNLQVRSSNVTFSPIGSAGVTEWELAGWLRSRAVENIVSSTSTLQSLAKLLGEISNIVIKDAIGEEVKLAVSSIEESIKLLAEGKDDKAFFASKKAVISSEKAFFDQSLLELLYFPEDQKFAIYIPLFLPVSIPVIISTFHAIRWMKRKWSGKLGEKKKAE
ncbi:GPI transamidase component PIG-S [Octopus bimaculoides]|uniref:GPI transamidase component PIG-S n=2 Tax=Octopus bimaculoides TaxID=37653 RepID=A0A0L8HYS3_OCTBM|nr:GPI transamidase component PIG-S [Octopus bimaculoides]|eukprot:XP_014768254.1 PREDICTED: GPI transamidase component PIG-S-like [Octopus bimaculoides]